MKRTIYIILAIAAAAYVIISAVKGIWNPLKWFTATPSAPPVGPADGTACTLPDNTAGEYKNGLCVRKIGIEPPVDVIERIIVVPGGRRVKCYPKPAGTSCARDRMDPILGMGALYSQNATSCCYIF